MSVRSSRPNKALQRTATPLCSYAARSVQPQTMKNHIAVLIASLTAVTSTFAASYSTEATITPLKDKTQYEAVVRVSQLVERDGKLAEELIAQPKITFLPGSPASLYSGLQPSNPNYQNEDNVSVDVSWPTAGEGGFALCTVTVKRGDKVVSKSKMKVKVDDK